MVNDNTLIKIVRARGFKLDWPEKVNQIKSRWKEVKLGFPGIGNDHVSLVEYKTIKKDDLFIIDPYFNHPNTDTSMLVPVLLQKTENSFIIEGIGKGLNLDDPDRDKWRWKDQVVISIPEDHLVWRIDVRPTLNGGPGYYYFFKSPRDFRL